MAQAPPSNSPTVTVNVSTLSNALVVAFQQAAVTNGRDQSASASASATIGTGTGTRVNRQQSGTASSSGGNVQGPRYVAALKNICKHRANHYYRDN